MIEQPSFSWLMLFMLTAGMVFVNPGSPIDIVEVSRSHWRLSEDATVLPVDVLASDEDADEIMHVLQSLRTRQSHFWTVHCKECFKSSQNSNLNGQDALSPSDYVALPPQSMSAKSSKQAALTCPVGSTLTTTNEPCPATTDSTKIGTNITCQPYVNLTQYDHLPGVANRHQLVTYPEPEVAAIFRRNGQSVHLDLVARRLAVSLTKKPVSAQIFNQAGNLLRVRGDSYGAVECFRRALLLQPNNPDVLLNLARVLFNHNFLSDAIALTRRSLETQSPDRNAWLQHFTLGEILRAYGHFAEAAHHFRHTVALNPGFAPAQNHLKELEPTPQPPLTVYTFAIILFLVLGVLAGLLTTAEANLDAYGEVMKTQRHFNRAMAMKTLKLSINPKVVRSRRQN